MGSQPAVDALVVGVVEDQTRCFQQSGGSLLS
jgi:hypothetical protein